MSEEAKKYIYCQGCGVWLSVTPELILKSGTNVKCFVCKNDFIIKPKNLVSNKPKGKVLEAIILEHSDENVGEKSTDESGPENLLSKTEKPFTSTKPFKEKVDALAAVTVNGIAIIDDLRTDVNNLAENLARDFSEAWEACDMIHSMNIEKLENFIKQPFFHFPVQGECGYISKYSRMVLYPDCINADIGFVLSHKSPYKLSVCTPHSMITTPITGSLRSKLEIPIPPDLAVHGSKIIGSDLEIVWDKIPGVAADDDHTDMMPSVKIVNRVQAYSWLINNCIVPWSRSNIPEVAFYKSTELKDSVVHDEKTRVAFKTFRRAGRMLMCWKTVEAAIEFCINLTYLFKGQSIFITPRESSEDELKTFLPRKTNALFVRYEDDEFQSWKVENAELVILLYEESVGIDGVFDFLLGYQGCVIIISNESPLFDSLEENSLAPILYSIAGFANVSDVNIRKYKKKKEDAAPLAVSSFVDMFKNLTD